VNATRVAAASLGLALATFLPARGQGEGMQEYAIVDPVLNMPAWTLTVPAGWHADGTMLPGSACDGATSPIYRVTSPDGLSGVYLLPRSDWAWGAGAASSPSCLPFQEPVSAKDFLTYQTRIEKVAFVKDLPVPELAAFRQSAGPQADIAHYLVRYSVDGHPIDEVMTASVNCHQGNIIGIGLRHSCSAFVSRLFAPSGHLKAILRTYNAMKLKLNQEWMSAWTAAMVNRTRALYQGETQRMLAQGELAQAARMQAHDAYMSSMEQGREIRNQNFNEHLYQKQHNTDNFVDYVLDCQRAYSGNYRVSGGNCPNRRTF